MRKLILTLKVAFSKAYCITRPKFVWNFDTLKLCEITWWQISICCSNVMGGGGIKSEFGFFCRRKFFKSPMSVYSNIIARSCGWMMTARRFAIRSWRSSESISISRQNWWICCVLLFSFNDWIWLLCNDECTRGVGYLGGAWVIRRIQ